MKTNNLSIKNLRNRFRHRSGTLLPERIYNLLLSRKIKNEDGHDSPAKAEGCVPAAIAYQMSGMMMIITLLTRLLAGKSVGCDEAGV
jgi:hypothetical protein